MKLIPLAEVPVTQAHDSLARKRFIGPGDLSSNIQTVNFVELAEGESFTPHLHPDCEECFFILEGQAEAIIEDRQLTLSKSDFLVVEPNEMHVFKNVSRNTFKYFQFRVLI